MLPTPAWPPVVTAFPLALWGSGMWQESTDLNKASNSAANGLCVLGNFSAAQKILDYITVSPSALWGPPVTCVCVSGWLPVPLYQSRVSGTGSQALLMIW